MLRYTVCLLAIYLSGCAHMENRVSCTVAKDEAFVNSLYFSIGITSKIDARDAAVLCK